MPMPNFLVIGGTKSGTTSLNYYLAQHPEIYMPPGKQTYFFAFEGEEPACCGPGDKEHYDSQLINRLEDYLALFEGVTTEKAIGEVCSVYLYHPKAPERIRYYIPEAKLIVNLRNPADMAYSSFMQQRRDGYEPVPDFEEALRLEEKRIQDKWRTLWWYTKRGFYYEQLSRYYRMFKASQIRIYLYDDFKKNPESIVKDIFAFLVVDDSFEPNMTLRYNVGGIPRNRGLQGLLAKQNKLKKTVKSFLPEKARGLLKSTASSARIRNLQRPPLSPEIRQKLILKFRGDILKLQDLIGRDLSSWLT